MIISGFYFLFIDMLYYQILLNLFTKYTTILRKITVEKMKLHIIKSTKPNTRPINLHTVIKELYII